MKRFNAAFVIQLNNSYTPVFLRNLSVSYIHITLSDQNGNSSMLVKKGYVRNKIELFDLNSKGHSWRKH